MPIPSFVVQDQQCKLAGTLEVPLVQAPYSGFPDTQFDINSPVACIGSTSKTTDASTRLLGIWVDLLTPLTRTRLRIPSTFSGGNRNTFVWHDGFIYTSVGNALNPRNQKAFVLPMFFGTDFISNSFPSNPFSALNGLCFPSVLDANGGDSFTFNGVAYQRMTYRETVPGVGLVQVERPAVWMYKSLGSSNGAGMHNIFAQFGLFSPGFARQPNPMRASVGLQVDGFIACVPDKATGMNYIFQNNSSRIMALHGQSYQFFNSGVLNPSKYYHLVFDDAYTNSQFGSTIGLNQFTAGTSGFLCWNAGANGYPNQSQAHACILISPDGTQFYIVKFVAKDGNAQSALNNAVGWSAKVDFLGNWFFRSNTFPANMFTSGGLSITFRLPKYKMVGYGLPCWNPCWPVPINVPLM